MSIAGFNHPMAVLDYRVELARGNIPNCLSFGKFGRRLSVATGSIEDIWCGTVTPRVDLTSPEKMELVSTAAADNGTSTAGANTVLIFGVDGDWNEIFEQLTLNGTTPVPTVNMYLRVNFMITASTGGLGNAGTITASAQVTDTPQDVIDVGEGYSCSTHYAVPKGKRIVIPNIQASVERQDEAELSFKVNSITGSDSYIDAFRMYLSQGTTSADNLSFSFDEMTDIKFQVRAITNNININCFYTIYQFPAN